MPPNRTSSQTLQDMAAREPDGVAWARIAVLSERVDTAINGIAKMEGGIAAISAAIAQMAVLQEQLAHVDNKTRRLFELSDASQARLAALESETRTTARLARLGLWAAPFFIAALVWAHAELLALRAQDAQQASRLTLLEFVQGGAKPGERLQVPPDTSAGK